MRGSPPCLIAVRRFGIWRGLVSVVAVASTASLVGWLILTPAAQGIAVRVATGFAILASLALAWSLVRVPVAALRWDGSCWTFRDLASAGAPLAGELEVAVDFGSFVLLRFRCRDVVGRPSTRWIPVERRGLEREWHSFRCAVYSPRPVADVASAADLRLP
jgi:hypothetical protein